ncbi:SAM-dependent methyltransferase [Mesoflavibacter sabulilitoris]|uniref:Methyltransferase type 11 domain-containing protein n=1 Tax=Mesoflavibacter zeaxanthinifaciens subsp. sabulilitoris TaxID=1520893 RepID=A0A2T1N677_9FLAO|nr:methyltransferase domain-containing protein [Mesoflavibacter zeaxanthinifaciens]MBB3123282.1 SAM-dependent methyltransferase [Mesoflavibacter zeaxanthinifaciens subsp. sabulilitoris]PSG87081.1 hypothetical protein C7H61_13300 [Mesoflavibacter zeaxanthinifaciens subsp. sabulilitoris]
MKDTKNTSAETVLTAENYYDNYGSFYDLNLTRGRMKKLSFPDNLLDFLRKPKSINFLVLGSATTKNINAVTQIGFDLRTKANIQNDIVNIIDINDISVALHEEYVNYLDKESSWGDCKTPREASLPTFPYPQFNVEKMDMCRLKYENNSIEVVISDYTLNFLSSFDDLRKVFQETSRVLTPKGIFICVFKFSENPKDNPEIETREANLKVYKFHLKQYLSIASKIKMGLVPITPIEKGGDTICVFQKL